MRPHDDILVSVLIPTYERQELLSQAVASVRSQTMPHFEIIVIDDASPTRVSVPDDPRIRLIRQPANAGKSNALNVALNEAVGEFVAFLDDDDQWTADRLHNALRAHREWDADVVVCGVRRASGWRLPGRESWLIPAEQIGDQEMLGESMGCISVRREVCPAFEGRYRASQDLEWSIRLSRLGLRYAGYASKDWLWGRHDGPRNLNGEQARISAQERLLSEHQAFYVENRRALANRAYRLGVRNLRVGNRRAAMKWLFTAFRAQPRPDTVRLALRIVASLTRPPRSGDQP